MQCFQLEFHLSLALSCHAENELKLKVNKGKTKDAKTWRGKIKAFVRA